MPQFKASKKSLKVSYFQTLNQMDLNVNLTLELAPITAVFGSSGSGKTTLLRLIAGLDISKDKPGAKPNKRQLNNQIEFNGQVWLQSSKIMVPAQQRQVGFVMQSATLFPHLSVEQNLCFAISKSKQKTQELQYWKNTIVRTLGIGHLLASNVNSLSGGEQQLINLARTLMKKPKLLLLDEPVSALDQSNKHRVLDCLLKLPALLDMPIIFVSHSLEEITRICDDIVLLQQGQVIAAADLTTMLMYPKLNEIAKQQGASVSSNIEVTAVGYEPEHRMAQLQFSGGNIWVLDALQKLVCGSKHRVFLKAQDLSLSLQQPIKTSMQNIFEGWVLSWQNLEAGQVILKVDLSGVAVLVEITQKAFVLLGIQQRTRVFVQVKSTALMLD